MKLTRVIFLNTVAFGGQVKTVSEGSSTSPDRPGSAPASLELTDVGGLPAVRCSKPHPNGSGELVVYVPITNVASLEFAPEPRVKAEPTRELKK